MSEILSLLKDLVIGGGSPHDVGLRLLLLLLGSLSSTVMYYFWRDLKAFTHKADQGSSQIEKLRGDLAEMRDVIHRMDESVYQYKKTIGESLLKSAELMQRESLELRTAIIKLEGSLKQTELELQDSHETRKDVYGFMKDLKTVEEQSQETFGRVIVIEGFKEKYQHLFAGLEAIIKARKLKAKK